MAWAKNGTPSNGADDLDITDLTAYKFNTFMYHAPTSGDSNVLLTLDDNGNTDYAYRQSTNGGTDGTSTSATSISAKSNNTGDSFAVIYVINLDSEEKLIIWNNSETVGAGATQAPARREIFGKVDTTTNSGQFTRIDIHNSASGSYSSGDISALGTD